MKQFRDDLSFTPNPFDEIRFPLPAPIINWRHIDGPVLFFSDGQMQWLSIAQRFMVRLGIHDADSLQVKLRPNLTKLLTGAPPPSYNPTRSTPAL